MTMPPPPARHSSPKPCGAAPLCRACLFSHNLSSRHQSRRRTRAWTTSHVRSSRRYQPPRDSNICLKLRKERKELAGCFYQLLTGHASIDAYLAGKMHTIRSSERWWAAAASDSHATTSLSITAPRQSRLRGYGGVSEGPASGNTREHPSSGYTSRTR